MNKKKIGFFSIVMCLLTVVISLTLTKASAEVSETNGSSKSVDTITSLNITNNKGGNLDGDLPQLNQINTVLNIMFKQIMHLQMVKN